MVEDSTNPDATPFVIDASGNVGIGTTSPISIVDVYSATAANLTVRGDSGTNINAHRNSTDASGPNIVLRKSRGTSASQTAVASSDTIGSLFFSAYGGTTNRNIASILGTVGTYTSDTDISSVLTFNTTPTGSVTATERMRIDSSGNVGIGDTTPSTKLDVAGVASAVFYENPQTITADYTITTNSNAMAAGPITIASGVSVTIPSGSVWTVV